MVWVPHYHDHMVYIKAFPPWPGLTTPGKTLADLEVSTIVSSSDPLKTLHQKKENNCSLGTNMSEKF